MVRRCHEQRVAPGGMVFHVLNRGVARMQLFEKAADYQAFEQVLQDTLDQSPMRICACAVMPNHWHLLLWPECDGELAAFMRRLTITHVRRWQEHRGYAGLGHVYQGRYKSFPVESDEHFWVVARYVERNALRANLVLRAEEWRWSSLWQRCHPTGEEPSLLAAWPIDMPANWLERVNQTDDAQELEALRRSVQRGRPFGQPEWQKEIAQRLGLESAYRPTGRPRKVGRNQTTAKNGARIVVNKRSLWQRKALKGSRLRLLIWGVLAAFLVVEIKMPRPVEDRSDVGGAAQFNNRTCPAFRSVPLSPPFQRSRPPVKFAILEKNREINRFFG